jgi:hypothetical protein
VNCSNAGLLRRVILVPDSRFMAVGPSTFGITNAVVGSPFHASARYSSLPGEHTLKAGPLQRGRSEQKHGIERTPAQHRPSTYVRRGRHADRPPRRRGLWYHVPSRQAGPARPGGRHRAERRARRRVALRTARMPRRVQCARRLSHASRDEAEVKGVAHPSETVQHNARTAWCERMELAPGASLFTLVHITY